MSERRRPDCVCLAVWSGGAFDPSAWDASQRAAAIALLQRTALVTVGTLAGPLPALEALLREAGPQYRYRCTPPGPGGERIGVLYDETQLAAAGLATVAALPDPQAYLVEFVPCRGPSRVSTP